MVPSSTQSIKLVDEYICCEQANMYLPLIYSIKYSAPTT